MRGSEQRLSKFLDRLNHISRKNQSLVCVGL